MKKYLIWSKKTIRIINELLLMKKKYIDVIRFIYKKNKNQKNDKQLKALLYIYFFSLNQSKGK